MTGTLVKSIAFLTLTPLRVVTVTASVLIAVASSLTNAADDAITGTWEKIVDKYDS